MRRRRPSPRVFLSYRRQDASGHAGRLYDDLVERYGGSNVFMDIDTIGVGADFTQVIEQAVGSCDALIALVGPEWATVTDETGRRRLDDPRDFVRLELETALAGDVPVVPVCVRGASFPSAEELPSSIAPLARRQGAELRDVGWRDDVNRLVGELERLVRPEEARLPPWWRTRWALAVASVAAALVVAAIVAVVALRDGSGSGAGAFPNAAERQLLAVVPAITRSHCDRIDYGDEAATAAIECSGGAGTAVTYNLFESAETRDAWYERTRAEAGVEPSAGSCTPQAFKGDASYEGGRYVCWFDGREPLLAWMHGGTAIGARANSWQRVGEAGARTLLRQWQCCMRPQG
jgi:TIR domain